MIGLIKGDARSLDYSSYHHEKSKPHRLYHLLGSRIPACRWPCWAPRSLGPKIRVLGFRVEGLGFRVEGLGFRVEGLGLRV